MHDTFLKTNTWRRADPGLEPAVATLFRAWLLWNLGFGLYATVATLYLREIGADYDQIGLVLGGAAVGRTLLSIPAGILADRVSPVLIVAATMALPVLGMVALLASTVWWQAVLAVLVVELSGLGVPALSKLLAATASPENRPRAFTWLYTVAPQSALLVGPALSGLLADRFGYAVVFVTAAVCFGAGVALLIPLVRTTPGVPARSPATSVASADPASSISGSDPSPDPFESGDGLSQPPGPPSSGNTIRQALRQPGIRFVLLLHVLVPLLPYTGFVLLANFLVEERGVTVGTVGLLGSISAGAALLVGLLLGRWRRLRDPFTGLAVCLGCGAAALGLIWLGGPTVVLIAAVVLRGALSPVFALLSVAVAQVTPPHLRGRVFGVAETGAGVGDIAAPVVAGGLYQANPVLPLLAGLLTTAPMAVWVALSRSRFRAGVEVEKAD